jgi:hypothetical protein
LFLGNNILEYPANTVCCRIGLSPKVMTSKKELSTSCSQSSRRMSRRRLRKSSAIQSLSFWEGAWGNFQGPSQKHCLFEGW